MSRRRVEVETVGQFKALGNPLRQRLLSELTQPMSVADMAERLQVPAPRLYHHVRVLQQHGFITEAGTRRVRSNDEQLYARSAGTLRFSGEAVATPEFRSQLRADVAAAVDQEASAFVDALMAWEKGQLAEDPPISVSRRTARLTPAEAREVSESLSEAVQAVLASREATKAQADVDVDADEWVYVTLFFPEAGA